MGQEHAAEHGTQPRRSSNAYPEDRFDHVPHTGRVGAHRVNARPRFVWQYIVATALGTALLTTVGIIAVTSLNSQGKLPTNSPTAPATPAPETVKPVLDPAATVVLLDGTNANGDVAMRLDPIVTENAWGSIISAGPAASSDVEISAVFYSDPADEPAALGLAEKLGGLSAYQTSDYDSYGARLVVLIGLDYAGPGLEAPAEG